MNLGPLILAMPDTPSLIAIVFLVVLPLWWVLSAKRREHLGFRIVCTLVAALALATVLLKPSVRVNMAVTEGVLITEGGTLDETGKSLVMGNNYPVFALADSGFETAESEEITVVPDIGFLARRHPEIRTIHVLGYGLETADWQMAPGLSIIPHLAEPGTGIVEISWQGRVVLGGNLEVRGKIHNPDGSARLMLVGPGGEKIPVRASRNGYFQATAIPRATGRFTYRLTLENEDGEIIQDDPVHLTVIAPRALNVLILTDAPSFEVKYLRDWFNRIGAGYLIRARISKDRFRWEQKEHEPFDSLDSAVLQTFDVVFADRDSLISLGSTERNALAREVNQGLGLFIPFEAKDEDDPLFWRFAPEPLEILEIREVSPYLAGLQRGNTIPVDPYTIEHRTGQSPLLEDLSGRVLAAALPRGKGKVATSLVRDTHQWVLQGHDDHHEIYWSHLLSKLARPEENGPGWRPRDSPPYSQDRALPLITTRYDRAPMVEEPSESVRLPSVQDKLEDQVAHAVFFPREPGWHQVENHAFHINSPAYWQSIAQAQRSRDTLAEAKARRGPEQVTETVPRSAGISPAWFLAVFLVASAALWVERKLSRLG